ncbi:MAG: DUF4340 domain-containing protein [Treponema sp.]|jgi:hypothetical protein|nr:DUF4340 domain-containing protein [Treponema sp.]
MLYKKQTKILLSIIAALILVYVLSIIFEPERRVSRSAAFTWLEPKLKDQVDRIRIINSGETKEFVMRNHEWFVVYNGREYPARQFRIEDFLSIFTQRAQYPLRASTAFSHERLGLTEAAASRIILSGGVGLPLLDLLIGQGDLTGQNVYLRRQGQNDVRSGEDRFTAYMTSPRSSWYSLRFFPESEGGRLDVDGIQRVRIITQTDTGTVTQVFTRSGREWTFSGLDIANPDMNKVDTYIRGILYTEGDDFIDFIDAGDQMFSDSRIELEFGNGTQTIIRLSPPDENNRRYATMSGAWYVYSIPGWVSTRLFRDAEFFEKD